MWTGGIRCSRERNVDGCEEASIVASATPLLPARLATHAGSVSASGHSATVSGR
jgi:hypothetical protein